MARRYVPRVLLMLLAVGVGLGVAVVARVGASSVREIRLEARNMTFYLQGDPTPNPELQVAPGETIRLVLVNRDRGIDHDVSVESLEVGTRLIPGDGSTSRVTFRAPVAAGEHEYACTLHHQLMRGILRVSEVR